MSITALNPFADMPVTGAGKFPPPRTAGCRFRRIDRASDRSAAPGPHNRAHPAQRSLRMPPAPRMLAAAASSFSCLRPTSMTFAPCSANRSAMRCPMPLPPPVTKATLPPRRFSRKISDTSEEYHGRTDGNSGHPPASLTNLIIWPTPSSDFPALRVRPLNRAPAASRWHPSAHVHRLLVPIS